MVKYCKTCGFRDPMTPVCLLKRHQIDPNNDFCSHHKGYESLGTCHVCGNEMTTMDAVYDVYTDRYLHKECAIQTCKTCRNSHTCEFQTNPDPLPKQVMTRRREGSFTIEQSEKNPARIEKFCFSCECFDPDFGCFKENDYCNKWKEQL